jgi:hypothetical protein
VPARRRATSLSTMTFALGRRFVIADGVERTPGPRPDNAR